MELCELLDTVTVAYGRKQGRGAHIGTALASCYPEIVRCGIEVTRVFSYKGTLTIEIERGPICKLEIENWQRLLQRLAGAWRETTGFEEAAEFHAADGWYALEVVH